MAATRATTGQVHTKLKKLHGLTFILSALLIVTFLGLTRLPSTRIRPTPSIVHPASHTNEAGNHRLVNTQNSSNGSTPTQTLARNSTTAQIPFMGNYNCSDDICSQFLNKSIEYYECNRKSNGSLRDIKVLQRINGKCHFMDGSNRAPGPVGLISPPGSGNTWVRGLLEQATGICTGSVYCDGALRSGGFIGEGFRSGAVLAVKSHRTPIVWKNNPQSQTNTDPLWGSVILIIRNPLDALVAEWNRRMAERKGLQNATSHTAITSSYNFGTNQTWGRFVNSSISTWKQYFVSLVQNGIRMNQIFLIIRYEDLKSDTLSQVKKMMNFLKVPVSDELLEARMSTGYEKFHRSHPQEFEHYTPEQKQHVLAVVKEVINMLQKENNGTGNTFGMMDYIKKAVNTPP